jgi:Anti-sigma factor NepR
MLQARPKSGPKLDRTSQQQIGQGLKRMYEGLVQTPVPDRLLGLLAQLDEKLPAKRTA